MNDPLSAAERVQFNVLTRKIKEAEAARQLRLSEALDDAFEGLPNYNAMREVIAAAAVKHADQLMRALAPFSRNLDATVHFMRNR